MAVTCLIVIGAAVGGLLAVSSCEHPEVDSAFGDSEWTWSPPGQRCTWTEAEHGVEDEDGPGWIPRSYLVVTAGVGVVLVHRARCFWRPLGDT